MKNVNKSELIKAVEQIPEELWNDFCKEHNRTVRDILLYSVGEIHVSENVFKMALGLMQVVNEIDELELAFNSQPENHELGMALAEKKAELDMQFNNLEEKIDSFGAVLKLMERDLAKWEAMKDIFDEKKKQTENQIKNMKTRIGDIMNMLLIETVVGRYFTAKLNKPTRSVMSAEMTETDLEALPQEFVTRRLTLNKAALKAAMERGEVFTFATLEERRSLSIK